jgi:hypothetical protein
MKAKNVFISCVGESIWLLEGDDMEDEEEEGVGRREEAEAAARVEGDASRSDSGGGVYAVSPFSGFDGVGSPRRMSR